MPRTPEPYWLKLEPYWKAVSIYRGPPTFLAQFAALPADMGVLFASHWCQSEVCNGGFHQFFSNPTGVLAPEASASFRRLGLIEWSDLACGAMKFFGDVYPREQDVRVAKLAVVPGTTRKEWDPFCELDARFYAVLALDRRAFIAAANEFAARLV